MVRLKELNKVNHVKSPNNKLTLFNNVITIIQSKITSAFWQDLGQCRHTLSFTDLRVSFHESELLQP